MNLVYSAFILKHTFMAEMMSMEHNSVHHQPYEVPLFGNVIDISKLKVDFIPPYKVQDKQVGKSFTKLETRNPLYICEYDDWKSLPKNRPLTIIDPRGYIGNSTEKDWTVVNEHTSIIDICYLLSKFHKILISDQHLDFYAPLALAYQCEIEIFKSFPVDARLSRTFIKDDTEGKYPTFSKFLPKKLSPLENTLRIIYCINACGDNDRKWNAYSNHEYFEYHEITNSILNKYKPKHLILFRWTFANQFVPYCNFENVDLNIYYGHITVGGNSVFRAKKSWQFLDERNLNKMDTTYRTSKLSLFNSSMYYDMCKEQTKIFMPFTPILPKIKSAKSNIILHVASNLEDKKMFHLFKDVSVKLPDWKFILVVPYNQYYVPAYYDYGALQKITIKISKGYSIDNVSCGIMGNLTIVVANLDREAILQLHAAAKIAVYPEDFLLQYLQICAFYKTLCITSTDAPMNEIVSHPLCVRNGKDLWSDSIVQAAQFNTKQYVDKAYKRYQEDIIKFLKA